MTDRHRTMASRLDDDDPEVPQPVGPEPREPSDNQTLSSPVNELENRLFGQRKVLVFGAITDKVARDVTGRLLALAGASDKPIDIIVNSPGGHVESGDTVHDMIRFWRRRPREGDRHRLGGERRRAHLPGRREGTRLCLPNTRFLLHQPTGGVRGQASDIEIEAEEIIKMRERVNRIIARETGQTYERVERDTERNYWMGAEQAVDYGMVGRVVSSMREL